MKIRFKNKNKMPSLYPKVIRQDPTSDNAGFVEVDGFRLRRNIDLIPQRGMQENLVASDCNLIFLTGSATSGKEQPYDAKIVTPYGYMRLGDIQVGDIISSADGGTQKVCAIYEQGTKPVYRITFTDGATTECGLSHLWKVAFRNTGQYYGGYSTVILKDLIDKVHSGVQAAIPFCAPVRFKNKNDAQTFPEIIRDEYSRVISVPDEYKLASVRKRIETVHDLYCDEFEKIIRITNKKVAHDLREIIWSLGWGCKISESYIKVYITKRHIIQSIDYVGEKRCRCIRVSSPDCLYLTDDFIVTHNTFGGLMASMKGIGHQNYTGRVVTMQSKDGDVGTSMARDFEQIYGKFANCKLTRGGGLTAEWPQWNNAIKAIHINYNPDNPAEWDEFKQVAKANTAIFFYIDEGTGIKQWKQFAYLFSRNRDASGAMNPTMIMSFNPEHNHFTTTFLKRAGYIGDDWQYKSEKNGVVTFFYANGDDVNDIVFGDTREEVARLANITLSQAELSFGLKPEDLVKTFTCFFASPIENKILVNITHGESIANLAAVGKTEGAKMYHGYFGPEDTGETKITPEVIENIFKAPVSDFNEPRYATLDVSAGGDLTIMWIWRGLTIVGREDIISDDPIKIEEWVEHNLSKWGVASTNFAYDSGGMGFFLKRFKDGYAITSNMRPVQEIDSFGNATDSHKEYYNIRSQLMAKFEAMLLMGDISCEISPQTIFLHKRKKEHHALIDILMIERELFMWGKLNGKIMARTKDVFKKKYGYSPDAMDSLWLVARFHLDSRPKKEIIELQESDYYEMYM